jgi:hypothetical protein
MRTAGRIRVNAPSLVCLAAPGMLWRSVFAPEARSLCDRLNGTEVTRIAVAAVFASVSVFAAVELLSLRFDLGFPTALDASFATLVFATVYETRRRLAHGEPTFSERPGRLGLIAEPIHPPGSTS